MNAVVIPSLLAIAASGCAAQVAFTKCTPITRNVLALEQRLYSREADEPGRAKLCSEDSSQEQLQPQDLFKRVAPSVFVVETLDDKGIKTATGSGVVVGRDLVVTNKHVISDAYDLRVRHGEKSWSATVWRLAPDVDLCLLRVEGLDAVTPVLRPRSTLMVGERVFAIGAPLGLELTLSDGLISGLRQETKNLTIQTTAAISRGSSGGGLFDGTARLIGITTFALRGAQNLNFALPVDAVIAVMGQSADLTAKAWASLGDEALLEANLSEPSEPPMPGGIEDWLRRMGPQCEQASGLRKRAVRAYLQALTVVPADNEVWAELGSAYGDLARGDHCQNVELAIRHTKPQDSALWLERMANAYQEAMRLYPEDLSLNEKLARGYAMAREYRAAILIYQEALRRQPQRPSLWVGLAEAHAHLSQADQALRSLAQAENLRPTDAWILCRIGLAYKDLGKRKQARKAIQEAVRLDPKNSCSHWLQVLR